MSVDEGRLLALLTVERSAYRAAFVGLTQVGLSVAAVVSREPMRAIVVRVVPAGEEDVGGSE